MKEGQIIKPIMKARHRIVIFQHKIIYTLTINDNRAGRAKDKQERADATKYSFIHYKNRGNIIMFDSYCPMLFVTLF